MEAVDFAKLGAQIAAGGWPAWIAAGVIGIILIILAIWWNNKKVAMAQAETQKTEVNDQAGGVQAGQTAEQDLHAAEEHVNEHRTQGKKPRPIQ